MKLFIGLGNPGEKYKNNRHNVGHMVVDALASVKVGPSKLNLYKGPTFIKTNCFMNDSGSFVNKKLTAYGLQSTDLYIVHDDLDIPLGMFKIQFGRGPKGHNGILDIEEKLGTSEFWRVRVGIDNKRSLANFVGRIPGEDYVLSDFTEEEKIILDKVIKEICKKLVTL